MPDPKLQAYLAQHYLSGPKADAILSRAEGDESKKRKKKRKTAHPSHNDGNGLQVRDDSDDWKKHPDDDEDISAGGASSGGPQVVSSSGKSKFRKGGFKGVGPDGLPLEEDTQEEKESPEDAPLVASITSDPTPLQPSTSGPRSGLRTKEQVRAERIEREQAEKRERDRQRQLASSTDDDPSFSSAAANEEARLAQTTVHRDASGRRIDIEAEEESERRESHRRKLKQAEKRQANRGEVQRAEEAQRRRDLERIKDEGVARYATDARMNEELKAMQRTDDPALAFLTKKKDTRPSMPKYKGPPPPPNRFGIQPGYRWDGVVRGNGFEKKLFEARGERTRREQDASNFSQM